MQVITIHFPIGGIYAFVASAAAIVATLFARWLTVGLPIVVFRRAMRLPRGSAGILTRAVSARASPSLFLWRFPAATSPRLCWR
jgi:hypothetical protein